MPGHVPRQAGPCRGGGTSSGNAVGAAWWWAGRDPDKLCPRVWVAFPGLSSMRRTTVIRALSPEVPFSYDRWENGGSEREGLAWGHRGRCGWFSESPRLSLISLSPSAPTGTRGSGKSKPSHAQCRAWGRGWVGPSRAGARRGLTGHTAPFLPSGALQGEGFYLQ